MLGIFNESNNNAKIFTCVWVPSFTGHDISGGNLRILTAHFPWLRVLPRGAVNLSIFNVNLTERRRCTITTGFFPLWNLSFQWPLEITFHTKCDLNINLLTHLRHLKKSLRNANLAWRWLIETLSATAIVSCLGVGQSGLLHTLVVELNMATLSGL